MHLKWCMEVMYTIVDHSVDLLCIQLHDDAMMLLTCIEDY